MKADEIRRGEPDPTPNLEFDQDFDDVDDNKVFLGDHEDQTRFGPAPQTFWGALGGVVGAALTGLLGSGSSQQEHNSPEMQSCPIPQSYSPSRSYSPPQQEQHKEFLAYHVIEGARIITIEDRHAQYVYVCERCGTTSSGIHNIRGEGSGSILNSSFYCTNCHTTQSVKIRVG